MVATLADVSCHLSEELAYHVTTLVALMPIQHAPFFMADEGGQVYSVLTGNCGFKIIVLYPNLV